MSADEHRRMYGMENTHTGFVAILGTSDVDTARTSFRNLMRDTFDDARAAGWDHVQWVTDVGYMTETIEIGKSRTTYALVEITRFAEDGSVTDTVRVGL